MDSPVIIPLKRMLVRQVSKDEIVGAPVVNVLCNIYTIHQVAKTRIMRLTLELPDSPDVAFALTQMMGKELRVTIAYSLKEEAESSD